jgi:hypothetical protein
MDGIALVGNEAVSNYGRPSWSVNGVNMPNVELNRRCCDSKGSTTEEWQFKQSAEGIVEWKGEVQLYSPSVSKYLRH